MKKALVKIIIIALLLNPLCIVAYAEENDIENANIKTSAEAAILLEYFSGKVMYSKNPDKRLSIASVTKLMTILLACEACEQGRVKLSDIVVTSEHASSIGGSQVYLEPGEEMTFEEMLIAVDTGSANNASVAIAEHIAGSEEAFVKMMNEKAKELGLKNTHFSNPTGLPAKDHYSSAADVAVILSEALKYPLFRRISNIYEYDLRGGEFKLWNTSKLLKWYPGLRYWQDRVD